MNRRILGFILAMVGFGLAVTGIIGLVITRQAPQPEATVAPAAPAAQVAPVPVFKGTMDNPPVAIYAYSNPGASAPDVPAYFKLSRVTVHNTKNPATGAPSDSLLLQLGGVPKDKKFTVFVLVDTEKQPTPAAPDDIQGLQWMFNYTNGRFFKSARRVGPGGATSEPAGYFNFRFQGLGDRVEVEAYGPPGTRYYAVLITNGVQCSLVVPQRVQ